MRVLLIDDDPAVIDSMRLLLELDGHEVLQAAGGDAGIALFLARAGSAEAFDVVITDFSMPNAGGELVVQTIKKHSPRTPVVLMTGWGDGTRVHETSKRVDFTLEKPVRLEELRSALSRWVV